MHPGLLTKHDLSLEGPWLEMESNCMESYQDHLVENNFDLGGVVLFFGKILLLGCSRLTPSML